jgi:hypothetical protein
MLVVLIFIIALLSCGGVKKKIDEQVEEEAGEHFEFGGVEHDEGGNMSVNDLPSDFPGELIYPGMSIESITTIQTTTGVEGDSNDGSDKIMNYYRSKMPGSGWQEIAFNKSAGEASLIFIKGQGQRQATIAITGSDKSGFNSQIIITHSTTPQ